MKQPKGNASFVVQGSAMAKMVFSYTPGREPGHPLSGCWSRSREASVCSSAR